MSETENQTAGATASAKKVKMVEAIVARGSVRVGEHKKTTHAKVGERVKLPADEAKALLESGVLRPIDKASAADASE